MIIDIKDKVVVITGSSRGIGNALARGFAQEGARVVINYRQSEQEASDLFQDISALQVDCLKVKADVSQEKEVRLLYEQTLAHFGHVDVLINNAGICADGSVDRLTLPEWQRVIDVNLTGCFLCCKYFVDHMRTRGKGKVFNIASLMGQIGSAGQTNYATSKAAVIGLTRSLAKELGPSNILVNCICPGFIQTGLNLGREDKVARARRHSVLDGSHALDDLVNFLIYASSDCFSGISGQLFHLDARIL